MSKEGKPQRDLRPVLRLAGELHRRIGARLREIGEERLSPSHGHVMVSLHKRGDLTPSEIAEATGKDISTVTSLVTKLVRLGYVSRRVNPQDRRSALLNLTETGRAHHTAVKRIIDETGQSLCNDIQDKDWDTFQRVLKTIGETLER